MSKCCNLCIDVSVGISLKRYAVLTSETNNHTNTIHRNYMYNKKA